MSIEHLYSPQVVAES